ncbi:carbon-nitrogen hydrolase family protein [Roseicitreum antarcticum]|uniref:Predicted amidohydrolase n=1 Tax=Roseicitreum antarcticum TaxID=564137 RepID=A0A1H2TP24_9RHOB|nr:carbon-nitrogen hydrolase family protein [Roseicitreum antarcticum]SDW45034.1 Predicted amidohydrolase [Roseicitreum antarcticum]
MKDATERNDVAGTHLRLAMVQMTSSNQHADNVEAVHVIAHEAAKQGAQLLALPEAAGLMNRDRESARLSVTTEDQDPYIAACMDIAREHRMWVQTGSTPVLDPPETRFRNRGHLIDPDGQITARYDKIHLFDVNLPGEPARRESDRYAPGEQAVVASTPWGRVGMSVCYDLRFPHLYREYARQGATVMFIPSAFAMSTGAAHWEILLRARAIENGCFVVAAAQNGHHADGRQTWGHSMIIDPWGRVLTDMKTDNGIAVVDLDMEAVTTARQSIPAIENERRYVPALLP